MKEIQDRLQYLLDKYATKTASKAEEGELFTLASEAEHGQEIKSIMLNMMQAEAPVTELNKEQWEPVLRKVLAEAGNDRRAEAAVHHLSERKKAFRWKSLAAAAAVFILISTGVFYFINKQSPDTKVVVKLQPILPKADITPPSSVNAVLTLSNGQKIVLDSAGNGTLARQGTVNVVKLDDGQIVYNAQDVPAREMLYNTLTVPRGSKVVTLALADGSKVWLNSESTLRYPTAFIGDERKVEITGEAYFEVAHNAAQPFHVSVEGMDVEVLGTHFNINSYKEEGSIKTTLLEGSVKITLQAQGDKPQILKPGQQARVNQSAIQLVNSVNTEEVMAWKNGKFSYSNTGLETIMRQIARWYNVEVVYRDKVNDRYTVNVPRDVPVSQLFKFIEMSGGVHFAIEGKTIVVKK